MNRERPAAPIKLAYGGSAELPAVMTLSPITFKRPSYPANQLDHYGSLWAVPLLFAIVKSFSIVIFITTTVRMSRLSLTAASKKPALHHVMCKPEAEIRPRCNPEVIHREESNSIRITCFLIRVGKK